MKEEIIILKFLRIILHTILIGLFHVGCSVMMHYIFMYIWFTIVLNDMKNFFLAFCGWLST